MSKAMSDDSPHLPAGTKAARIKAAAARARAEAEARRRERKDRGPTDLPPEKGGRAGPEPTRYGDWEKDGIVSDF